MGTASSRYHGDGRTRGKRRKKRDPRLLVVAEAPTVTEVTSTSATVSWPHAKAPLGGAGGAGGSGGVLAYWVEGIGGEWRKWTTVTSSCQTSSIKIRRLRPDTTYRVRVCAENMVGVGPPSPPSPPITTSPPSDKQAPHPRLARHETSDSGSWEDDLDSRGRTTFHSVGDSPLIVGTDSRDKLCDSLVIGPPLSPNSSDLGSDVYTEQPSFEEDSREEFGEPVKEKSLMDSLFIDLPNWPSAKFGTDSDTNDAVLKLNDLQESTDGVLKDSNDRTDGDGTRDEGNDSEFSEDGERQAEAGRDGGGEEDSGNEDRSRSGGDADGEEQASGVELRVNGKVRRTSCEEQAEGQRGRRKSSVGRRHSFTAPLQKGVVTLLSHSTSQGRLAPHHPPLRLRPGASASSLTPRGSASSLTPRGSALLLPGSARASWRGSGGEGARGGSLQGGEGARGGSLQRGAWQASLPPRRRLSGSTLAPAPRPGTPGKPKASLGRAGGAAGSEGSLGSLRLSVASSDSSAPVFPENPSETQTTRAASETPPVPASSSSQSGTAGDSGRSIMAAPISDDVKLAWCWEHGGGQGGKVDRSGVGGQGSQGHGKGHWKDDPLWSGSRSLGTDGGCQTTWDRDDPPPPYSPLPSEARLPPGGLSLDLDHCETFASQPCRSSTLPLLDTIRDCGEEEDEDGIRVTTL